MNLFFPVLVFLWILCQGSSAQERPGHIPERLKLTLYSKKDGLLHPQGQEIFEDSRGFIWLWNMGLSRFDGHSFRNFADYDTLIQNRNGLIKGLSSFHPDDRGRLWTFVPNGYASYYDPVHDRFRKAYIADTASHVRGRSVYAFDASIRKLWVADEMGLILFDPDRRKIRRVLRRKMGRGLLYSMIEDRYDNLVILERDSIYVCNKKTLKVRSAPSPGTYIYKDGRGELWIGQWGLKHEIGHFDSGTLEYTGHGNPYGGEVAYLTTFPALTGDTVLWAGMMEAGIGLFDTKNRRWIHRYSMEDLAAMGLPETRAKYVFTDSRGILWFHSQYYLVKVDPENQQFLPFRFPNLDTRFPIDQVLRDSFNRDKLWLRTDWMGAIAYDTRKKKVLARIPASAQEWDYGWRVMKKLVYGPNGRLWACMEEGVGEITEDYRLNRTLDLEKAIVTDMAFDSEGGAYLATYRKGLVYWQPSVNRWHSVVPATVGAIRNLLVQDDYIWAATSKGVFRFDRRTGAYTTFSIGSSVTRGNGRRLTVPDTTRANNIRVITAVPGSSDIWLGSHLDGVFRLTPETGEVRNYGIAEGLQSLTVTAFHPDQLGRLWFSTYNGLYRLDPDTGHIALYNEKDGVHSSFIDTYTISGNKGEIYIPGNEGYLTYVAPEKVGTPSPPGKALFTGFFALEEHQPFDPDSCHKQVYLLHRSRNTVRFDFTVLDFHEPGQIRFEYQLEGVDEKWNSAGTERYIRYLNLGDGDYRLRVRAVNSMGLPGEAAEFRLEIWSYFWEKPWFPWLLAALAALLSLVVFFRIREKQKQRLYAIRTTIARDLHDDVSSHLSSISLLSQVAVTNPVYLEDIGQIARNSLDSMREIIWSITPGNDKLDNLLEKMQDFARELLENQDISVRFEVQTVLERHTLAIEKRRELYLVFKEAIHNAGKHAGAREVCITFREENRRLEMIIADDGVGFVPESGNGSRCHGLRNMKDRAKALKGELEIISAPGQGTTIILKFPY